MYVVVSMWKWNVYMHTVDNSEGQNKYIKLAKISYWKRMLQKCPYILHNYANQLKILVKLKF